MKELITPEEAEKLLSNPEVLGLDEEAMPVGKVLIFSVFVGEEEEQLSIASGVPLEQVKTIAAILRNAKVFGAGLDHRADYLGDGGGLALGLDVACGQGQLMRGKPKDGEATWVMTDAGLDYEVSQKWWILLTWFWHIVTQPK